MLDTLISALTTVTTGVHLLYLIGGVFLGLAIGIFPGLGGIVGLSLLLPFIYGMDQVSALAMLIGLVAVIPTSDTFTSVLMGIPGSSASQATVLDGFPLAKQGQAARALGAAFSASLFGGLFGAVILTGFILIAQPVILAFGSAELFMLTLLGLSMVGVLAGRSMFKGLAACGLGLLLGSLGAAPATGEYRMSMEIEYLMDGVPLVVVGLGMFAVPEIIDLLRQNRAIAGSANLGAGWLDGLKDMIRNKWLCLRCAGIGCLVGALPGLGGSVVDWIAYGHTVQVTKDKSKFGQGEIRGVLGPESANNAKEGGGLIPTLLFGIPGSGSMAVFLGGMVLIGLEPGPSMVTTELETTYVIAWSLALANVFGAGSCLILSSWVARLTTIRYTLLAPFMIMVICFAAFQATRSFGDMAALFFVGTLGILMKRFGWPRPAFLIGFVLADGMETYLYQAVQFHGWGFVLKPGVIIIGLITVISVYLGARFGHTTDENAAHDKGTAVYKDRRSQLAFAGALAIVFLYGAYDAFHHSFLGGIFSAGVSLSMLVITGVVAVNLSRGRPGDPVLFDHEVTAGYVGNPSVARLSEHILWFAGFIVGVALVGYLIALLFFFALFLRLKARSSWLQTVVLTASAGGFMVVLGWVMVLDYPRGLLQDLIELPWPIG
jgi:TctA family transporter